MKIYFYWKLLLLFMSLLGFRFILSGFLGFLIYVYIKYFVYWYICIFLFKIYGLECDNWLGKFFNKVVFFILIVCIDVCM